MFDKLKQTSESMHPLQHNELHPTETMLHITEVSRQHCEDLV